MLAGTLSVESRGPVSPVSGSLVPVTPWTAAGWNEEIRRHPGRRTQQVEDGRVIRIVAVNLARGDLVVGGN